MVELDPEDLEIPEEIEEAGTYDEDESDNPMFAVEDALDAHGLFRRQADGTLEFDEFLTLKEIILRQSLRLFAPKKAVLTEQKIKALKEKNTKEYMAKVEKLNQMIHYS